MEFPSRAPRRGSEIRRLGLPRSPPPTQRSQLSSHHRLLPIFSSISLISKEEASFLYEINQVLERLKNLRPESPANTKCHGPIIIVRDIESLALPCPCPPTGHLSLPTHKGRSAPGASPPKHLFSNSARWFKTVLTIISFNLSKFLKSNLSSFLINTDTI